MVGPGAFIRGRGQKSLSPKETLGSSSSGALAILATLYPASLLGIKLCCRFDWVLLGGGEGTQVEGVLNDRDNWPFLVPVCLFLE